MQVAKLHSRKPNLKPLLSLINAVSYWALKYYCTCLKTLENKTDFIFLFSRDILKFAADLFNNSNKHAKVN